MKGIPDLREIIPDKLETYNLRGVPEVPPTIEKIPLNSYFL